MHRSLVLLLAVLLLPACPKRPAATEPGGPEAGEAEAAPSPSPYAVRYRDRVIDIEPHVTGYPYRGFRPLPELGVLLYFHEGEGRRTLMKLPLDGELDLAAGTPVHDIDWNTRSFRGVEPLPGRDAFVLLADEDNREEYDLYLVSLADGGVTKLTDVPYIYGFHVDHERERLFWVARYPNEGRETYTSCLEWQPLDGGPKTEVVCDDAALNFTWTGMHTSPDGRWVYLNGNLDNDRARRQLLRVDTLSRGPVPVRLTEADRRTGAYILDRDLDEDTFVFWNDESGFGNAWLGSHATGALRPLTAYEEPMGGVFVLDRGKERGLLTTLQRPFETELQSLASDGTVLDRLVVEANLFDLHATEDRVWFYATSRRSKLEVFELSLDAAGKIARRTVLALPEALAARLEHCEVQRVQIPTFDLDPKTGAPRLLHAYYSTPKVPPAGGEPRLAGLVAFYGGDNSFDTTAQILCEAGIASLSASVRGSWGFGAEFAALNDKDLGGDEIVDLHHLARWLVEEHGYEPRRLGVYGGSHGGYAAMRALTFPPETNGRDSDFDWGWGVSWFGFSDIRSFWEKCNIPDWVLLEAGDPETEPDKIRDRSPLHHVDRLDSALLLLHGENDLRVPVQESRQFAEACGRAGKDCVYVEFPGQGHGLKGLQNQTRVWREVFGFLERVGG